MSIDLIGFLKHLGRPRVLVLGDLMLDGSSGFNSVRLKGAGKIAAALKALDVRVSLAGALGRDEAAGEICHLLNDLCIEQEAVIIDGARPTTMDEGNDAKVGQCAPLSHHTSAQIWSVVKTQLRKADLVLISDYSHGVCTPALLAMLIASCRAIGLPVIAQAVGSLDQRKYHGCSALVLNRQSAEESTGRILNQPFEVHQAATHLREELDLEAVIITLDQLGIYASYGDAFVKHATADSGCTTASLAHLELVSCLLAMALAGGADHDAALEVAAAATMLAADGAEMLTRESLLRELCKLNVGNTRAA